MPVVSLMSYLAKRVVIDQQNAEVRSVGVGVRRGVGGSEEHGEERGAWRRAISEEHSAVMMTLANEAL